MGEKVAGEPRWYRSAFGRPRLWNGIAWLVFAVIFAVVSGFGGSAQPAGLILACLWFVLGVVVLSVAARDRRLQRGRYAPPTRVRDDS